jgi:hypothetical protein
MGSLWGNSCSGSCGDRRPGAEQTVVVRVSDACLAPSLFGCFALQRVAERTALVLSHRPVNAPPQIVHRDLKAANILLSCEVLGACGRLALAKGDWLKGG